MFASSDESWKAKQIVRDVANVFYSEGSRFRNELRTLKLAVPNEQRKRFKEVVRVNQRAFFLRYDLEENLKSNDAMVNLVQVNIFEGFMDLCRNILRDARHVAEPLNADNNSNEDTCDKPYDVIIATGDAVYENESPDVDSDSTYGPTSDENSTAETSSDSDSNPTSDEVDAQASEQISSDEEEPTSRDLPGTVIVSPPSTNDDLKISKNSSLPAANAPDNTVKVDGTKAAINGLPASSQVKAQSASTTNQPSIPQASVLNQTNSSTKPGSAESNAPNHPAEAKQPVVANKPATVATNSSAQSSATGATSAPTAPDSSKNAQIIKKTR